MRKIKDVHADSNASVVPVQCLLYVYYSYICNILKDTAAYINCLCRTFSVQPTLLAELFYIMVIYCCNNVLYSFTNIIIILCIIIGILLHWEVNKFSVCVYVNLHDTMGPKKLSF